MLLLTLLSLSQCILEAWADVTVYGQIPFGHTTTTAADAAATTLAAYNDTILEPPPVPNPPPATAFTLDLPQAASGYVGLSIPMPASFFGFSIEMSVITQVVGKNSTHIHPVFLNFMGNIVSRGGLVRIRMGGNTQEFATYTDSEHMPEDSKGRALAKQKANVQNPTETPAVMYSLDFFYMMANISALLPVGWYLGIPFNDTTNWRLQIAEYGQQILGDNLLGLQAGNEPDLYASHGHRDTSYDPSGYFDEVGNLINIMATNNNIPVKNRLIAPSVATGDWTPEMVWETGFIDTYKDSLSILTVEHYPNNNCFAQFGIGAPRYPQIEFPNYLNHTAATSLVDPYRNSATIALAAGKPLMMFETNTASCGGFPGISDSFGAALWALDYGMQMAASNFSGALLHIGGQNVFYNPFTAPPTNQSSFNEWTVGAVYYSAMIMAEAFGKTNTSRIVDVQGNEGNIYTPQYAIYENDQLAKVALFNYITDASGASDYVATIHMNGGTVPSKVYVKYLASESVSTKNNITWAGQTFGTKFTVDGRLKGDLNIVEVNCDIAASTCAIPVPAPGFALVFLNNELAQGSSPSQTLTFATTAYTKGHNTATIDPSLLATSNGHSGKDRTRLGSTSQKSGSADSVRWQSKAFGIAAAIVLSSVGALLVSC